MGGVQQGTDRAHSSSDERRGIRLVHIAASQSSGGGD